MNRRDFLKTGSLSIAAACAPGAFAITAAARHEHIGHTGITWSNEQVDQAIQGIARLGLYGFETFGDVLQTWETKGTLKPLLQQNKLPFISAYCSMNLTEPEKKQDELRKTVEYCKLIKEYNGRIFVLGPNPVKRSTYSFASNKANIIAALNDIAKTVRDQGLTPVLHQHTGTCIESRDETYAVLDAVDTTALKFGPDVGQLTKGGQDAVKVVKDYLPLVQHMHLKDFSGKDDHLLGYCPLGQGKVDVPAILDLMAGRKISGMVMIELDNDPRNPSPTPPASLVQQSRDYLKSLGVVFRA